MDYIDVTALLLLIVANTTPVVVGRALGTRLALPVDANHCMPDGRPTFGPHKTWRGLATGVLVTGMAGPLLHVGFARAAAFGALALLGDLATSFVKRRLALGSGHAVPWLDQLPEALLPLILTRHALHITTHEILGTTLAFVLLDVVTERLRPPERAPGKTQAAHPTK